MRYNRFQQNCDYEAIARAACDPETPATEVSEEAYMDALTTMPPKYLHSTPGVSGMFAVSEATTDSPLGHVHAIYAVSGGRFYAKYGVPRVPTTHIHPHMIVKAYAPDPILPTVEEICEAFANADEYTGLVVQMPENVVVEPRRVFLAGLSAWVMADGSQISYDMQRDAVSVMYQYDDQAAIAAAFVAWFAAHTNDGRAKRRG